MITAGAAMAAIQCLLSTGPGRSDRTLPAMPFVRMMAGVPVPTTIVRMVVSDLLQNVSCYELFKVVKPDLKGTDMWLFIDKPETVEFLSETLLSTAGPIRVLDSMWARCDVQDVVVQYASNAHCLLIALSEEGKLTDRFLIVSADYANLPGADD